MSVLAVAEGKDPGIQPASGTNLNRTTGKDAAGQLSELQKSIAELRQQVIVANDAQRPIDVRAPTHRRHGLASCGYLRWAVL